MYPLHDKHLCLYDISNLWARDPRQAPPAEEVLNRLFQAMWQGDLDVRLPNAADGDASIRERLLNACLIPDYHPRLRFVDEGTDADGSADVSLARCVIWRADDEPNSSRFEDACLVMSAAKFDDYSDIIKVTLTLLVVQRDRFANYCQANGWRLPAFWFPRRTTPTLSSQVRDARRWLKDQADAGKKAMSKNGYMKACQQQVPGLSGRQFMMAWDDDKVIPKSWKTAGRPLRRG